MNSNKKQSISIFWFRRDLRLKDNHGLYKALRSGFPVLPIFIFDDAITNELPKNDARLTFIHDTLQSLDNILKEHASGIDCRQGKPIEIWAKLISEFDVQSVFTNEDYEPYAIQRDQTVSAFLGEHDISLHLLKDQVIFEKDEVVKNDGKPYTVYTPFKNKWLERLSKSEVINYKIEDWNNFLKIKTDFPSLSALGFERSLIKVLPYSITDLDNYDHTRNFPAINGTSKLGPHLRFGTISIREILLKMIKYPVFISELVWREFFMQILYHFPDVVEHNFKRKYDHIHWRNNEAEFEKWKTGQTGYPMVDAGIRELNKTGYMHNRVRMVVAGFLCKHLLIDWKWGEAYFAEKLLDYELSANNGNWQWSAGTGCDAAPYFRIFNPITQVKKFDSDLNYIRKWIPELDSFNYPSPMIDHKFARERAIETYKRGLQQYK